MTAALANPTEPYTGSLPVLAALLPPACSAPAFPEGPCPVCPRLAQEFEPWRQAGYWKALHERALQREALLKQEIEQLRAQLRLREQQLFGRKTEATATAATTTTAAANDPPRRPRGQQPGQPGPRRRDYSHLPAVLEELEIPGEQCCCRRCGRPFAPVSGAVWSGKLAALLFSLLQTLCLWGLNPRSWLTAYLTACAEAGGQVPEDVERFLPWHLSEGDRRRWSLGGGENAADTS